MLQVCRKKRRWFVLERDRLAVAAAGVIIFLDCCHDAADSYRVCCSLHIVIRQRGASGVTAPFKSCHRSTDMSAGVLAALQTANLPVQGNARRGESSE